MREKKYIDRLYQEKFKDFEAAPDDLVWKKISSKLHEKNRRKTTILPLWQRIAGVAAFFAFLLLIGEWFSPQQSSVVNNENEIRDDFKSIIPTETNTIAATSEEELKKSAKESEKNNKTDKITPVNPSEEKDNEAASGISALTASSYKEQEQHFITEYIVLVERNKEPKLTKIGLIQKKSIFDEILNLPPENEVEQEISNNKLEISTYAAPVFYGNLGEGNFLDPKFNDNSSQGEITYSYGFQIAYTLSKNLKIRSGINKVNMSYNTQGIAYNAATRPMAISAITYSENQIPTANLTVTRAPKGKYRMSAGSIDGALLNQKLGYLEVPVELEYNLIDKKFEVKIIGGASTLFLDENMVSVSTGSYTKMLGEANNLNDISFSTNVGLGLDYNLSETFKLNLEPMFKYQLNTFNTASSQYQPFYLAIYTGVSYKF